MRNRNNKDTNKSIERAQRMKKLYVQLMATVASALNALKVGMRQMTPWDTGKVLRRRMLLALTEGPHRRITRE